MIPKKKPDHNILLPRRREEATADNPKDAVAYGEEQGFFPLGRGYFLIDKIIAELL